MIKQQGKYQPELLKTYPPFKCDELELLFLTDWYISKINKNDPSKLSKITSIDEIGLYQEYNICYKLFYNLLGISCLFMQKFRIPCSLIRKDWIGENKSSIHYCSQKCSYTKLSDNEIVRMRDKHLNNPRLLFNGLENDADICYKTSENFIYGYIKSL